MIDICTEQLITFAEAAEEMGVSLWTVRRWARRGTNGVRLKVACIGRRVKTSMEALQRFLDAVTRIRGGPQPPSPRETEERQAYLRRVKAEAVRLGIE